MADPEEKRLRDIYRRYEEGDTLEEICKPYGLTRERIRQLLQKAMLEEISRLADAGQAIDIEKFVKEFKRRHSTNRLQRRIGEFDAMREGILERAQSYHSLSRFSKDENLPLNILKDHFPGAVEAVKRNAEKHKQRWSRFYLRCRRCGTTSIKHQGMGLCRKCYLKSDYFKEINRASFERNREKRKKQQRVYLREYMKRPEVIAKKRQAWDKKHYGGNRERAISRDGNRCVRCGIDRETSEKKLGRDLYVRRRDNDPTNNVLENLETLCRKCFQSDRKSALKQGRQLHS